MHLWVSSKHDSREEVMISARLDERMLFKLGFALYKRVEAHIRAIVRKMGYCSLMNQAFNRRIKIKRAFWCGYLEPGGLAKQLSHQLPRCSNTFFALSGAA